MKIVQSFWSKPGADKTSWASEDMHYIFWALSCLKLKQFYGEVELVTDRLGKKILIDELCLPYDSVQVVLDDLNDYDSRLWALGKIYAYSIQDKPFIHVDSDVFVWERFPERLENAELVAQHKEASYEFSELHFKELQAADLDYYPPQMIQFRAEVTSNVDEANAGILGGNDLAFIKSYCKEAFDFVDKSMLKALKVEHAGMFNTVFEQYLFYCMANVQNKRIQYYFEEDIDNKFEKVVDFVNVPFKSKFIHLLSYYKGTPFCCQKVMQHLWYEFPEYYSFILKYLKNRKS